MKYAKNSSEINHFDPFHLERHVDLKYRDKEHQAPVKVGQARSMASSTAAAGQESWE